MDAFYTLALRNGIPVDFTRPPPQQNLDATQCNLNISRDIIGYLYNPTTFFRFDLHRSSPVPGWMAGRDPGNHVVIQGDRISKLHFGLKWNERSGDASEVTITDFSSNGTYVNGLPLGHGHSVALQNGDRITLNGLWDEDNLGYIFYHIDERRPVAIEDAYRMGKRLGFGPFGTVYHAIELSSDIEYSIKVIDRSKWVHNLRTTESITVGELQDLRTMERISHENIVGLSEIFMTDDIIYLVGEYIENSLNLRDFVADQGQLSENLARIIISQVCKSVDFLHHIGIVVGNIKAENILLRNNDPARIVISDVGLASLIGRQTYFRTMLDGENYLAPETAFLPGLQDKADVWSIGVLTFYLLTGEFPFSKTVPSQGNVLLEFQQRVVNLAPLSRGCWSKDCVEFVGLLLMESPLERISVEDSLNHPWLTRSAEESSYHVKMSR